MGRYVLLFYQPMKQILVVFLFFSLSTAAWSQKTDYDWLLGYCIQCDPSDTTFGITHFNFNSEPPGIYYEFIDFSFNMCNTSICEEEGNLLFYSNGVEVFNADHATLQNSEDFNYYPYHEIWEELGLALPQGVIGFQSPNSTQDYYLLHMKYDLESTPNDVLVFGVGLYYSKIDMEADAGLGAMVDKGIELVQDTLNFGTVTATRHGNGRDWWVIVPEYSSNRYYRILIAPDGPVLQETQTIGEPTLNGVSQAVFSPDGKWYIRNTVSGLNEDGYLDIYQFDRCTGFLSNHLRFPYGNGLNEGGGAAVSSNNQFLYVSYRNYLYQYDLLAPNIQASKETVAVFDGFADPFQAAFYMAQLAPDGKIYLNCTNGIRYMHRIEYPNKKGTDCQVSQHVIHLPTVNSLSIPNFPNYRLGPLDGSACDTLGIDNHPLAGFRYDLDTSDLLNVEFTDNSWYEPETWEWNFGDNTTSNEVNPIHIYTSQGVYEVCLTVSNQYGSDTKCREVNLSLTSTGTTRHKNDGTVIYPNPANDKISIRLQDPLARKGEFRLYNAIGKLVKTFPLPVGYSEYRFPIKSLPSMIYFYTILADKEKIASGKLIKVD
jgi:hypothetical protein